MRGLELRGAGNLLGVQQSGHIAGVGFDLYCQLLRQSVNRLKGDPSAIRIRATVNLDFVYQGSSVDRKNVETPTGFNALRNEELESSRIKPIEAAIPSDYVPETRLRIELYRRLAMAQEHDEVSAMEEEMIDRFGKLPHALKHLLSITRIRVAAEAIGIKSVESEGNRLKCRVASSRSVEYLKLNGRFPRLTQNKAHLRLREIEHFLARQRPK